MTPTPLDSPSLGDGRKPAINTHVRLFDLVRQQRSELHEADLITDEEYAWLSGAAPMANSKDGGSPSPRRLEDYDDIRAELTRLRAVNEGLEAIAELVRPRVEDEVKDGRGVMAVFDRARMEALAKALAQYDSARSRPPAKGQS